MRSVFVAATVCAAILLLVAPVAPASPRADKAAFLRPATPRAAPSMPDFVPMARQLTGGATVSVDVFRSGGVAATGGTAMLVVRADDGVSVAFSQTKKTDAYGHVAFTGVPAANASGEIAFWPAAGDNFAYDVMHLSWADPEGASFTFRPGYVPVYIHAGGVWKQYFAVATIDGFTTDGSGTKLAETYLQRPTATNTYAATAYALPGTLTAANAYFFCDEGMELDTFNQSITAGSTAPWTLEVYEAEAQRLINTTWASGKPGSVFKVKFNNFPAGWVNKLTGDDTATPAAVDRSYGSWTSAGRSSQTKTLTIPRTATPGFTYRVVAQHTNGAHGDRDLTLVEPFQVCTLNPNRPFTRPPYDLYFTGRVPTDGRRKRVMLYRRYTAGGQPSFAGGFLEAKGWKRIGSWRCPPDGRFRSNGRLEGRTAWYCLWYAGDDAHWGAWTSVVRVPYYKDM